MATSEVQICNMALARIGVSTVIAALSDDTKEAQQCNNFYAQVRDVVLAEFHWPFAKKHATLTLLNETRSNWAYVYSLPPDCIEPRRLVVQGGPSISATGPWPPGAFNWPSADVRALLPSQRYPFEIEGAADLAGSVLLTDVPTAELVYTAQVTVPTVFPPLFVDALAWRLAQELVAPLSVKPERAVSAAQAFAAAVNKAIAAALRGQQEDQPPESEYIQVRGGY